MKREKDATRRHFTVCLGRATELLGLISQQVGTNPTYGNLQEIMSLRSELEDLEDSLVEELDCFQNSDKTYRDVSALGRATEEAVDDALSLSEKFLRRVTDVDGIFRSSKAACLQSAADVMALVSRDTAISPTEARCLVGLRGTLVKKFARIQGSWENLLQSALDCDESVAFIMISELVEVTEEATDNALFQSEDLLRSIKKCSDEDGVHEVDVTHEVAEKNVAEDEEADSPPEPRIDVATVDVSATGHELSFHSGTWCLIKGYNESFLTIFGQIAFMLLPPL